MESCVKAQSGSIAASSRVKSLYASSAKGIVVGLMGCAAFIALAYIPLITLSTSPHLTLFKGPFSPSIRSLLDLLHLDYLDYEDDGNEEDRSTINQVLEKASMPDRTVILTTLNGAWANEGAMINLFLESFGIGYGTQRLLQHLIFICVDDKAYERCLEVHPHCLRIKTGGVNLSQEQILRTKNYIRLVWTRIKFLKTVLEMNFNFVFTDTDVLWFRDPFPFLQNDTKVDCQMASDTYNQKPWDIHNKPNSGFMYVRANERTIKFLDYWHRERKRNTRKATQGIFNIIKFDKAFKNIGMTLHFLDPLLFGGFCTIQDTDMSKAITMHATCCKGLDAKLIDLRKTLDGWKTWQQLHNLSPQFDEPSTCIQSLNN